MKCVPEQEISWRELKILIFYNLLACLLSRKWQDANNKRTRVKESEGGKRIERSFPNYSASS